jgi:hypothetical protein
VAKKAKAPRIDLSFNFGASAKARKPRNRSGESKKSGRYREHVLGIPRSGSGGT